MNNSTRLGPREMIELILRAKNLADREQARAENARRVIGPGPLRSILTEYHELLDWGYALNPEPPPSPPGEGTSNSTADLPGLLSSSTISGESTIVIANPGHAQLSADFTSGVINFNGNDSIVLYETTIILDAISFTAAGSAGADTSIVRTGLGPGYDTTAGSIFSDFGVWSEIGQDAADSAAAGTDNAVGFSSLSSIPEPSIALLGSLDLFGLIRRRR